jgi:CheY-like chemotaxis protein/HPt (histidine-containing phosphotransfer) domain-containing protein
LERQRPSANLLPDPAIRSSVLVVDHHSSSSRLLADMLGLWGCNVAQAADAETALIRLRSADTPFDAVILDRALPDRGASRLAGHMHANISLSHTPVVLLTSHLPTESQDDWREQGFAARLTKPVKQDELRACLASVLDRRPQTPMANLQTAETDAAAGKRHAGFRLLVVEDSPTNQEVALGMLEILGYQADVVGDGRSALAALADTDYHLVLMDCQLPDLDGYQASRLIRSRASRVRNHDVPIIAMTAHAMAGDREKCIAAGMNDFVSKPIDAARLEQAIERGLRGNPRAAAEETQTPQPDISTEFDLKDLLSRLSGNQAIARRVARRFLGDMPKQLAALTEAAQNGNWDEAGQIAHSIKGAAGNAAGPQMRAVAAQIEQLSKSGDYAAITRILPELVSGFEHLCPIMEEFCQAEER